MVLAEPGREARGQGAIMPGLGHVFMVFVEPDHRGAWDRSILLVALHRAMLERGRRGVASRPFAFVPRMLCVAGLSTGL